MVFNVQSYTVLFGQKNTIQYSTVQYITLQVSTVQYSAVQYSTWQYSTKCILKYSAVKYNTDSQRLLPSPLPTIVTSALYALHYLSTLHYTL